MRYSHDPLPSRESPKLLDLVHHVIRARQDSLRTEEASLRAVDQVEQSTKTLAREEAARGDPEAYQMSFD